MAERTGQRETTPRVTSSLIASLALYEQRQAQALGFERGLQLGLWYAYFEQLEQSETERFVKVAMLNGIIENGQATMKQILARAQEATPEQQRELLKEAIKLRGQMKRASKQIKNYAW